MDDIGSPPDRKDMSTKPQDNVSDRSYAASKKLTVLPLIFLIYYEVSGGPIGTEESVQAAGPLLAILGFIVFPFIWSIPEALITAEMATSYPENGGYVLWTAAAFGPFWGFLQGWWKWVSGVINNATYPILYLDYLQSIIPFVGAGLPRVFGVFIFTGLLTYLNYRGLTIVGWSAVVLGVFCLLPFILMAGLALPRLVPARWLGVDLRDVNWRQYLNTLFWNLNFWDNASTMAGEVEKPQTAFPKALLGAGVLVGCCYLIPLLAGTGAFDVVKANWEDGYFAVLARRLGGQWLQWWIELGATLSCAGLFAAQMSSSSFQVLGMADMGTLPFMLSYRSSYGTPTIGILLSACGALLLSFMSFEEVIQAANALYSFGMLLEFAAFICLRIKQPSHPRPFRVPFGTAGSILMCFFPCVLLIFVLTLSSLKVFLVACVTTVIGLILYVFLNMARKKTWLRFSETQTFEASPDPVQSLETCKNEEESALLQEEEFSHQRASS